MTGGLGFVKDGMNSQTGNKRMVNNIKRHRFNRTPQSDFSRKYRESPRADINTLEDIRKITRAERQQNRIRSISLIALILLTCLIFIIIIS